MTKDWVFNPKRKSRVVQSFEEFSKSSYAVDSLNAIDNTYLGERIISHVGYERRIGISVENIKNCYGHYIPRYINLKGDDNSAYKGLDGLILIDKKDVDRTLLPFIFSHEAFHAMQDRNEFSGLVPMYGNGVIYNPKYRLRDRADFVFAFKTMERACDVVALCVAWEMKKNGLASLFNELLQNNHTRDIASCIEDAGEWALRQPKSSKEYVMDTCMFWGNMAGLWSETYNDYLDVAANKTYKDTDSSIFFSTLQALPVSPRITFSHFSLISDTFASRQWSIEADFEGIERCKIDRCNKAALAKQAAIAAAISMSKTMRHAPN